MSSSTTSNNINSYYRIVDNTKLVKGSLSKNGKYTEEDIKLHTGMRRVAYNPHDPSCNFNLLIAYR